jgi:hypothetical protein
MLRARSMHRLWVLAACAGAMLAMSVFGTTTALAASTNNPQYSLIMTTLVTLGSGETQKIEAAANGTQKLVVKSLLGNFTIACKTLKLNSGAEVIGSSEPNAGTSKETIIYGECAVEGKPKCEVFSSGKTNGNIETHALKDTLVYTTKAAAEKEETGKGDTSTLFVPENTEKEFVTLTTKGSECVLEATTTVDGEVIARNLGTGAAATSQEIEGIETGKYFTNSAGTTSEHEAKRLKAFGVESGYIGIGKIKFVNGESWGVMI